MQAKVIYCRPLNAGEFTYLLKAGNYSLSNVMIKIRREVKYNSAIIRTR